VADPTLPDPSHKKLTRLDPGEKFWPGPITSLDLTFSWGPDPLWLISDKCNFFCLVLNLIIHFENGIFSSIFAKKSYFSPILLFYSNITQNHFSSWVNFEFWKPDRKKPSIFKYNFINKKMCIHVYYGDLRQKRQCKHE